MDFDWRWNAVIARCLIQIWQRDLLNWARHTIHWIAIRASRGAVIEEEGVHNLSIFVCGTKRCVVAWLEDFHMIKDGSLSCVIVRDDSNYGCAILVQFGNCNIEMQPAAAFFIIGVFICLRDRVFAPIVVCVQMCYSCRHACKAHEHSTL